MEHRGRALRDNGHPTIDRVLRSMALHARTTRNDSFAAAPAQIDKADEAPYHGT
jgi:hypothetical protein